MGEKKDENVQRRRCDLQLIPYGHFVRAGSGSDSGWVYQLVSSSEQQHPGQRVREGDPCQAHANFMDTQKKATHKKCEIHFLSSSHSQAGQAGRAGRSLDDDDDDDKCDKYARCGRGTYTNTTHASLAERVAVKKSCTQFMCALRRSGAEERQPRLSQLQIVDNESTFHCPPPSFHLSPRPVSLPHGRELQKLCCRI